MTDDNRLRSGALSNAQVEQFIRNGFIHIDRAFPRELAEQGCAIMWRDIRLHREDGAYSPVEISIRQALRDSSS